MFGLRGQAIARYKAAVRSGHRADRASPRSAITSRDRRRAHLARSPSTTIRISVLVVGTLGADAGPVPPRAAAFAAIISRLSSSFASCFPEHRCRDLPLQVRLFAFKETGGTAPGIDHIDFCALRPPEAPNAKPRELQFGGGLAWNSVLIEVHREFAHALVLLRPQGLPIRLQLRQPGLIMSWQIRLPIRAASSSGSISVLVHVGMSSNAV